MLVFSSELRAVNTAPDSENRIHGDLAARYGFRGGLVPGVTIYGYLLDAVRSLGPVAWAKLRLLAPFYDGDQVQIQIAQEAGQWTAQALGVDGMVHAHVEAGPERQEPFHEVPAAADLPAERPLANESNLESGIALGAVQAAPQLPGAAGELELANRILMANRQLPPWIHTGSEIRFHAPWPESAIEIRGRIAERFERKGHQFVRLDVAYLATGGQLVQTLRHTAIWRLREPGD